MNQLNKIIAILRETRKLDACLLATCVPDGAKLSLDQRGKDCIDGSCQACGLKKWWSQGFRESLVDEDGKPRDDAPKVWWDLKVKWEEYAYLTKEEQRPVATQMSAAVARASARATRNVLKQMFNLDWSLTDDDDNDEDYAVKKKKELVVRLREGTIIEFLDEYELMLDKYVKHLSLIHI